MPDDSRLIPKLVQENLTPSDEAYVTEMFERLGGYPNLQQMWRLMDDAWRSLECDSCITDHRVEAFYRHPVWLLNGLFIEQHTQSLDHRRTFTEWVVSQSPKRVADFGGGFGGLARRIGVALPETQVEIVDPHPHAAGIALAAETRNVRYVARLSGEYDILIATDVFEHVPDPIGLTASTAQHLRIGGQYLIANCFAPVILCHLPQLFHLNYAWDSVMRTLGLAPGAAVAYGRAYSRAGDLTEVSARDTDACARKLHPWVSLLPRGRTRVGRLLMSVCSRVGRT